MVKTTQTYTAEHRALELLQHRLSVIGLWVDRLPHQTDQGTSLGANSSLLRKLE